MEPRCQYHMEQISAALDGELTAEERRELDAHLEACPQCAALFARLGRHSAALRALDAPAPAGLKDSILSRLPPRPPAKAEQSAMASFSHKRSAVRLWRRWGLAVCAALVLVAGLPAARLLLTPMGGGSAAPETAGVSYHHTTEPGEAGGGQSLGGSGQLDALCIEPAAADGGPALSDSQSYGGSAAPGDAPGGDTKVSSGSPSGTSGVPNSVARSGISMGDTLVAAVLTLSALPEGWEEGWTGAPPMTLDGGTRCYLVSGEDIDRLILWAGESGAVSADLTGGPYAADELCALCVEAP